MRTGSTPENKGLSRRKKTRHNQVLGQGEKKIIDALRLLAFNDFERGARDKLAVGIWGQ